MATVETLKNKDNNTFYPVTKTEAVYNADGSENLSVTLTKKADISTDAADANKMMKADGTKALVTSSNIDFTTLSRSGEVKHMGSSDISVSSTATTIWSVNFNSHTGHILLDVHAVVANFSSSNYEAYLGAYIDGSTTTYYLAGVTGTNMTSGTSTISGCRILNVSQGTHTIDIKIFMSQGTCIVPAYTRASYTMTEC